MVTYLLLRDNKQFGPLTLEGLTQKGFKAYDLVWVEGKSAAWRYPSEIDELKAFAPVVEEQPFDRFFKRPNSENKANSAIQFPKDSQKSQPEIATSPQIERQVAPVARGDKKIYVTLPARNYAPAAIPFKRSLAEERTNLPDDLSIRQEAPANKMAFGSELLAANVAEKNQPVEKKLQPNTLMRRKLFIFSLSGFGVLVLIGLGILIGLNIEKNIVPASSTQKATLPQNKSNNAQAANVQQQANSSLVESQKLVDNPNQASITQANPSSKNIELQKTPALKSTNQQALGSIGTEDANKLAEQTQSILVNRHSGKKVDKPAKDLFPKRLPAISEADDGSDQPTTNQQASVPQRTSAHRDDQISESTVPKANLLELIGVTANNYSVGTFGGISNLQITVSNRSVHPLELVVVEVQYIQANKKVFKTENIYFHNIGAGSATMLEAPKSPRGIKIQYKIALINSKETGLSYSTN
ncbi:MAG TPA: hypothetical protein VKR32_06170 [Puia sp.]|nr:hypothetical protein [Puia sp.]